MAMMDVFVALFHTQPVMCGLFVSYLTSVITEGLQRRIFFCERSFLFHAQQNMKITIQNGKNGLTEKRPAPRTISAIASKKK